VYLLNVFDIGGRKNIAKEDFGLKRDAAVISDEE